MWGFIFDFTSLIAARLFLYSKGTLVSFYNVDNQNRSGSGWNLKDWQRPSDSHVTVPFLQARKVPFFSRDRSLTLSDWFVRWQIWHPSIWTIVPQAHMGVTCLCICPVSVPGQAERANKVQPPLQIPDRELSYSNENQSVQKENSSGRGWEDGGQQEPGIRPVWCRSLWSRQSRG